MSELELRFPSDQPYAYFSVRGTPEELSQLDFELLAQLYVNTQFAVLKGTAKAKDAILGGAQPEPSKELPGMWEESDLSGGQTDSEKPQEHAVGDSVEVGGMTFTKHSEAADALSEGLGGATEIEDVNAPPWKGDPPAAKPKAWEQPKPKTEVSSDDFDF